MNPCPIRLGGDLTAADTSRIAADLVAAYRTAPLGILVITAGVPTAYYGRNGNGVATFDGGSTWMLGNTLACSLSTGGPYSIQVGTSWVDEIGVATLVNIVSVDVTPIGASTAVTAIATDRNLITLTGPTASDSYVLVIHTDDTARTIDQYGGSLNKHDSVTEAESPYAWGWLLEMRQIRGSAYANDGLVDVENKAWARMFGFLQRVAEQESAASDPANTSGGRLNRWAQWLGLAILSTDSEETIRNKCAAFKALKLGAADANLVSIISRILGPAYVSLYRDVGTFTAPPVPTYWSESAIPAGVNTAFNLGPGGGTIANDEPVWLSKRFEPTVIVTVPSGQVEQDVANLCDVDLARALNNLLPSVARFNWGRLDSYGGDEGFILDQSLLDFDLF